MAEALRNQKVEGGVYTATKDDGTVYSSEKKGLSGQALAADIATFLAEPPENVIVHIDGNGTLRSVERKILVDPE